MKLAPANSSAQRPAESVNFIGSTSVLSAYLLKVFCKWPIQKGHVVKKWVDHSTTGNLHAGDIIFVPRGTWIGAENSGAEHATLAGVSSYLVPRRPNLPIRQPGSQP